ncbi:MAG: hypothetical protein GY953_06325 [bacterium]|nr:hypothetical protein [bacterium]
MKAATLLVVLSLVMFFAFAETGEWTGHISDAKCGANHADHSEKSIKCVQGCVKGGQAAVFVTEDGKVVKISNPDKVKGHLGHQVKVAGSMADGSLTVNTVEHVAP